MAFKLGITLAICLCVASSATAQVVRFETNMGDIDMVLNPTNNAQLQGHVDNMLAYVTGKRYDGSWINRADISPDGTPFVLQMGGFYSHTKRLPITVDSTRAVQAFAPIQGAPGIDGLSNTVGTVSLALPGSNFNGGTSSFFVNLTDNSFLDARNFTVFAAISDMTVVNQIMALSKVDRTTDPLFGVSDPDNATFTDVPVQTNGHQVLIKRAFVLSDAMSIARAASRVQSVMALSAASFGSGSDSPQFLSAASGAVPEPSSAAMLLIAQLFLLGYRRRRPQL